MAKLLKILIAPLDWGLGHTSRCMPVIHYLRELQHEVMVAASGASAKLIEEQFPDITILPLDGYGIQYSNHKSAFAFTIASQIPKIIKAIQSEKKWLEVQMSVHHFDMVISDNRYGLYHPDAYCVFMTHQLNIQTGSNITNALLQKINYRYINRYDECWIVDTEHEQESLAGKLSHPKSFPKTNYNYIGYLSQLSLTEEDTKPIAYHLPNRYILALLSGPEPMRTVLENKLIEQMKAIQQYHFVLVAGKPIQNNDSENKYTNITYVDYLNALGVYHYILNAEMVICRSGYSTIMDLAILNKPAILIPTPGQTEQEYLATKQSTNPNYVIQQQSSLNLANAIATIQSFSHLNSNAKVLQWHQLFKQIVNKIVEKFG